MRLGAGGIDFKVTTERQGIKYYYYLFVLFFSKNFEIVFI